ncbi:MAG: hypothetical protein OXT74_05945, partial [Candidatus Poribacteria bacterium]|nr:hypothetical protein [Candidatus Poribacteria bacterium]
RTAVVDGQGAAIVEGVPSHNSATDGKLTWSAGWDPTVATETDVRLRFELQNAKLYAFSCN